MHPLRRPIAAVLLAVSVLVVWAGRSPARDGDRMADAAGTFLGTLSDEQRERASLPLESEGYERFHFIPPEMFPRSGVALGEMDATQRAAAHELLRAGLSQRGYLTATQVMELEDVLRVLEDGGRFARDRDEYYFTVFGPPERGGTWAWRFEGHHISLHFAIVGGAASVAAPAFVGANPADVEEGPRRGLRVLGDREDTARSLMRALDPDQRDAARIEVEAPRDIFTGNDAAVDRFGEAGIAAASMTEDQRALLMTLIDVYLSMMSDDLAAARRARITASDVDEIRFAWAGGIEPRMPHYYRVQGPTFLIEYDNVQNGANHIHSVWRDFDGDFGRDLLREHRAEHPHQ
ncbi:MAG: hypothetical protein AMS19_10635 [Gemmatimonas sp. SG8_23]|jgi:hypothetical protein|nr:MAG: hypothetical protein AMS19_10635 [Gemmatimonas sp. SG8_23]